MLKSWSARRRNWLLIAVVLALIALLQATGGKRQVNRNYFEQTLPMVIAHQGGNLLRPGNTMLAFEHAAALGVDVLEMDVHSTRDGVLVVMHDETVDRTTDGQGAIASMTAEELRRLDAAYHWPFTGSERPYRGKGVRVPVFDAVMARFPEMRFNVEIKDDTTATAAALCTSIRKHAAEGRTLVASFHDNALKQFRLNCPEVPTSASRFESSVFYVLHRLHLAWLVPTRAAALQLPPESDGTVLATARFIADARSAGLHVDYWTLNEKTVMAEVLGLGAGGIISDRPDLLLEVARAYKAGELPQR